MDLSNIGRFESRRAQRTLLRLRRVLVFVLATPAVYLELGILLVERERDEDELVLVVAVAVVARHHNARIANTHLVQAPLAIVSMPNRPSHPFKARTERKSKTKAGVGAGVAVLVRGSQ